MRMCTFSTLTSWCLKSFALGNHTTCRSEDLLINIIISSSSIRCYLFIWWFSCLFRFIPMRDTASDVQSLVNIMRLCYCTSSSRTFDEPFTHTDLPSFTLSSLLSYSPCVPHSHSSSYLSLHLFLLYLILLHAERKLCQNSSNFSSYSSVLKVLPHFSVIKSLQDWYSDVRLITVNKVHFTMKGPWTWYNQKAPCTHKEQQRPKLSEILVTTNEKEKCQIKMW